MINRKLSKEIQKMAKQDQKVRRQQDEDAIMAVTKRNTERLKEIVRKFGWPTIPLVGTQAPNSAWLLIQHADHDVKFQKHCLHLMREATKIGEVLKENVAYLTDRVLINSGKPQIYGTQFYKDSTGKLVPRQIRNIKTLDKIRKKIGLKSFELYQKELEEVGE